MNILWKIVLFVSLLLLFGCKKDEQSNAGTGILLLKIDFTTYEFEGGTQVFIRGETTAGDTLPIEVDYEAPGDFGRITLYYEPIHRVIFDASIIWMGTGFISSPASFVSSDQFILIDTPLQQPDDSSFQEIFNSQPVDYDRLWNAVSRLTLVDYYLESNKKIGVFLYTPSVGIGNPEEWDWFIIMNRDAE